MFWALSSLIKSITPSIAYRFIDIRIPSYYRISHITLYPYGWQEHSYVACFGLSIQPVLERLRQNPKLDMVYLCLDNDDAGNDACDLMTDTLEDMGLDVGRLCPVRKDWNDDLCAKFERKEKDA